MVSFFDRLDNFSVIHILWQISLFAFDLVMAVGHIIDIKWVRDGRVEVGHYCTAQGSFNVITSWLRYELMDPTYRCNQAIRGAGFQFVDTGA